MDKQGHVPSIINVWTMYDESRLYGSNYK